MTTLALDSNAILDVAEPVVRRQTHESTGTRPEALPALLARQRAAFLRDGPPSLARRRANLKKLRAAVLARRADLEAALDADFGHRFRHETAIMELLPLTWGIDYLNKNLRRFMRRERRARRASCASAAPTSSISRSALSASWLRGTIRSRSP